MWHRTTPGLWTPRSTTDRYFLDSEYVGISPVEEVSPIRSATSCASDRSHRVSGQAANNLVEGDTRQIDPQQVIAITLLQGPHLAHVSEHRQNAEFIATIHRTMPWLLSLLARVCSEHSEPADW